MTKPRTGATAMKHAKAILEDCYPVVQYAGKRVVHIPPKRPQDPPRIITQSEDLLHGCFDALAVGDNVLAVQVTSQTKSRSSVSNRKRKIEEEFLLWFPLKRPPPLEVHIWSWVNRQGFRVWRWEHQARAWREAPEMLLPPDFKPTRSSDSPERPPEPKPAGRSRPSAPARSRSDSPGASDPFD